MVHVGIARTFMISVGVARTSAGGVRSCVVAWVVCAARWLHRGPSFVPPQFCGGFLPFQSPTPPPPGALWNGLRPMEGEHAAPRTCQEVCTRLWYIFGVLCTGLLHHSFMSQAHNIAQHKRRKRWSFDVAGLVSALVYFGASLGQPL